MSLKSLSIGALLLSAALTSLHASDKNAPPLTLERAIQLAWERDPQTAALALAPQLSAARELQAGLSPPPRLEAHSALPIDGDSEWTLGLGIRQQIPRRERLALARAYARIDGEAAQIELRLRRRTLADQVRRRWYDCALQEAKVARAAQALTLQHELSESLRERYAAGEANEADWAFSELELARARQALALAEAQVNTARAQLRARLRLPETSELPLLQIELDMLLAAPLPNVAAAAAEPPQLARAKLEIRRAQAALDLARSESREDWQVGAGLEFERRVHDATGRLNNEPRLMLSTSAPWPTRQSRLPNRGTIAEREAALRIAQAQAAAAREELLTQAAAAHSVASKLQAQALRYQALCEHSFGELPQRLSALHTRGELSIFALAQARQQQREIEAEFFAVAARLLEARAEAEALAPLAPSAGGDGNATHSETLTLSEK